MSDQTRPPVGTAGLEGDGARLVMLSGKQRGLTLALEGEQAVIGRSPEAAMRLRESTVSRSHCAVRREGAGHVLVDLGSRHGTYCNGRRVVQRALRSGDRICAGDAVLSYLTDDDEATGLSLPIELDDSELTGDLSTRLSASDGLHEHPKRVLPEPFQRQGLTTGLEALRRFGALISEVRGRGELAHRIAELSLEALPAERAAILLRNDDGSGNAELRRVHAMGSQGAGEGPVRVSRTIAQRVARENLAFMANGVLDDPAFAQAESVQQAGVKSVICVPLAIFDRVLGVLYLDVLGTGATFEREHLELATAIGSMAAVALDAAEEDAHEDAQSGPPTEGELALVLRASEPLHLGTALALREALERWPSDRFPRTVLLMDHDCGVLEAGGGRPSEDWLDRLAILPDGANERVVLATSAPSIARLATVVAATLGPAGDTDARGWFQQVLLSSALIVAGASHALLLDRRGPSSAQGGEGPGRGGGQEDPATEIARARRLATRINKSAPGACARPNPVAVRHGPFLALDGRGLMGTSDKGSPWIADEPQALARKIQSARTDASPVLDPESRLSPEVRNLLLLHRALTREPTSQALARLGGQGYGQLKEELVTAAEVFLAPVRERRAELAADESWMEDLRDRGAALDARGRAIADLLSRPRDR